jgi:predicted enzyme related to lactoylglutathione lyase
MGNVVVWADIPVRDLARAREFYSLLLGTPVVPMPGAEDQIALLMPSEQSGNVVSADLALSARTEPSTTHGPVVYLGSNGDIDGMLQRALDGGGKIVGEKVFRGPMVGWVAWIEDTEGNLIGIQEPAAEKGA